MMGSHPILTASSASAASLLLWQTIEPRRRSQASRQLEAALQEELMVYMVERFSTADRHDRTRQPDPHEPARRVCQLVAAHGSFCGAALLLRQGEARALEVVGSAGIDDLAVLALNRWAAELPETLPAGGKAASSAINRSSVRLERRRGHADPLHSMRCEEIFVIPLQTETELLGVLVTSQRLKDSARALLLRTYGPAWQSAPALSRILAPVQALAMRLLLDLREQPVLRHQPAGSLLLSPGEPDSDTVDLVTDVLPDAEPSADALPDDHRRALDTVRWSDPLSSSNISLRRLLELHAPSGLEPPRTATGVSGFPAARFWS